MVRQNVRDDTKPSAMVRHKSAIVRKLQKIGYRQTTCHTQGDDALDQIVAETVSCQNQIKSYLRLAK